MISIRTGGQTGVDTGALLAAREAKVSWEAIMPKGHRREKPAPDWLKSKARVLETGDYEVRTREVVNLSGAILIVAPTLDTPGTKLTVKLGRKQGMPMWWHVPGQERPSLISDWLLMLLRLYDTGTISLMVAGPREGKWPDGEKYTKQLMLNILDDIDYSEDT